MKRKMSTKKAIELLWDKTAIVATLIALAGLAVNLDFYANSKWAFCFVILFIPALIGNLLSIPLFWRRSARNTNTNIIKLLIPSIIVGLCGWLIYVPFASWLMAPALDLQASFNLTREIVVLGIYLVVGEAWFYGIHRFLHAHKSLFLLFHVHHHRITDPHVANASYQHPVELIVITMGTAWAGPLLLPGHWITVAIWCALVMILGNYGHSGEESIHDEHHRRPRGNYGFLFMDALLTTTRADVVTRQMHDVKPQRQI